MKSWPGLTPFNIELFIVAHVTVYFLVKFLGLIFEQVPYKPPMKGQEHRTFYECSVEYWASVYSFTQNQIKTLSDLQVYKDHIASKGENGLVGCNWQVRDRMNFEQNLSENSADENPEDHQIPPLMDSDNDEHDPACLETELLKIDKELLNEKA